MVSDEEVEFHSPVAILFDLDGTLIDSLADLGGSVNRMLAERGHPVHPLELYREFVGDGMQKLVERALPEKLRGDSPVLEEALKAYQSHYEVLWCDQTRVYPGMDDLLECIQQSSIKTGVISNKPHHFTRLCVEHFFPGNTFEVILGQREGVARKPDPTAAVEAAQLMGVDSRLCWYVGDSGVDMKFARAANMKAIGTSWGFRSETELRENGAHRIFTSATDLLVYLNSLS